MSPTVGKMFFYPYPKVNAQGRGLPCARRRVKVCFGASALTARLSKRLGVENNKSLNLLARLFFPALPSQLRASGGCHRTDDVCGISGHFCLPAHGPVCGRGSDRLVGPDGVLPRGTGLSSGIDSPC